MAGRDVVRVTYTVEDKPNKYLLLFEKRKLVCEFLDRVRENRSMDDLCAVFKDGQALPLEDQFDIWYEADKVFQVTSDGVTPDPPELLEPPKPPDQPPDDPEPPKVPNTYTVYTNLSENSFKRGDRIDVNPEDTVDQVKEKIEALIRNMTGVDVPEPHELHIFLPGGLPFLRGTLQAWEDASEFKKCILYAVATRPLGDAVDRVITNVADCSSDFMKSLLSPLYDSTPLGYLEMACLLGYFQYDGPQTQDLFLRLARVTRFAPLICSLYRFMEHEEINGRNIIAITGILHTLFKCIPTEDVPNLNVLERTLKLMSIVSLIDGCDFLELYASDWDENTKNNQYLEYYCKENAQQKHFVVWQKDTTGDDFVGSDLVKLKLEEIDDVFETVNSLKPLSPVTARYVYGTTILKGNPNSLVMLGHVHGDRNRITIIDPATGRKQDKAIEDLCRETGDRTVDLLRGVQSHASCQIIEILFDASVSMDKGLNRRKPASPDVTRIALAKRFLSAFMSRTYAYRVPSIFGLFGFNKKPVELSALSPLVSDFDKAIEHAKLDYGTTLWDAIHAACDAIHNFNVRDDGDGEKVIHPNAVQRILVISDGADENSEHDPWDVAAKCVRYGIIVDAVIVSTVDENDDLCILCQLTGGMSYRTGTVEDGLALFEREAFLNISVRRLGAIPDPDEVNLNLWQRQARRFDPGTAYSTLPANKVRYECENGFAIQSPLYVAYVAQENHPPRTQSQIRIVSELKYIFNRPNPNIQVWVNAFAWEKWRVFLKGPDGTPYAGKWWSVYVTFPPNYPTSPPAFRFVSIPYHPNVSAEGKVIFGKVEEDYRSTDRVYDMIVAILDLLRNPELGQAIQTRIVEQYRTDRRAFENQARVQSNAEAKDEIDQYDYMQGVQRSTEPPKTPDMNDILASQIRATITPPKRYPLPGGGDDEDLAD